MIWILPPTAVSCAPLCSQIPYTTPTHRAVPASFKDGFLIVRARLCHHAREKADNYLLSQVAHALEMFWEQQMLN